MRYTLTEFGRIPRAELGGVADRLQAFDENLAGSNGETVFDWSLRHFVRAKNYVGVVQIPGLAVEILPKIDDASGTETEQRAKQNLLHMLAVTRRIPARAREVAALGAQRQSLLEALVAAFAARLLRELRRGLIRKYVPVQRNTPFFKGKLLVARHVQRNFAHQERAFVAYEEFSADNPLNQIVKATCRTLLTSTRVAWTERCLREALLHLADVQDVEIQAHQFEQAQINRNVERFSDLLGFCRLVHEGLSPAPRHGGTPSFSLLFPMDKLFEEFIGETVSRNARDLCPEGARIRLQARGRCLWLMRRESGKGVFRLKPDVLVDDKHGHALLLLDTKWKRLKSDLEDSRNGVSLSDVYQLYGYVQRYACNDAVLLFPKVPGVTEKTYFLHEASLRAVRVAFVDMSRDLGGDPLGLLGDLRRALQPRDTRASQAPRL